MTFSADNLQPSRKCFFIRVTYASIQSFYQYRMVDPSMPALSNGLSRKLYLCEMESDMFKLLSDEYETQKFEILREIYFEELDGINT